MYSFLANALVVMFLIDLYHSERIKFILNSAFILLTLQSVVPQIYKYTEIVLIPERKYGGQYPGLFLATSLSRMMRPVINLETRTIEYIGSLEQLYLTVAVSPEEIEEEVSLMGISYMFIFLDT